MTEEEYFKTDGLMNIKKLNRYSEPLYVCPKCGQNMVCRDLQSCVCSTSYPHKYFYTYQCLNETCDYEVTR